MKAEARFTRQSGVFARLARSGFRSQFRLDEKDLAYLERTGLEAMERHAFDFITARLAPPLPKNDGRQTPFRGHPVFKAQHATASCCRNCLMKWHGILKGRELSDHEIHFTVSLIMRWIREQLKKQNQPVALIS